MSDTAPTSTHGTTPAGSAGSPDGAVAERPAPASDATIRAALVATGFEYTDALWWRTDDDGSLRLYVVCNDFFHWGSADLEEITDDNVAALVETIAECEAIVGRYNADDAPLLWCARQRGMRPQGAYYKHLDAPLHHLFDAAGPARETDFFNPHPHPGAGQNTHA